MTTDSYLPKLDGLRAISISLVLIEHFLWNGHGVGGVGVTIFFVISGYLITSILLSYAATLSPKEAAAKFYWRRMLRLSPAYYLCIAVLAALNKGGMRQTWLVNALYLSNVKIAIDGDWNLSSHFWSLAVEEQFYLFCFFVVVVVARRYLVAIILLFIAVAPVYRWVMFVHTGTQFTGLLLPGVMDSLAMGALLSCAVRFKLPQRAIFDRVRMPLLALCLCLMIVIQLKGDGAGDLLPNIFQRSLWNVFSVCLVAMGIDRAIDWRFDWLKGDAIRHIGKISYGLYVYHYFVPSFVDSRKLTWLLHGFTGQPLRRFILLAGVSYVAAEISWHMVERPMMKLKDRFTPLVFPLHPLAFDAAHPGEIRHREIPGAR
jgi:peptidoglycan/LPS O-acetylase OafA/YrhL